MAPGVPCCARTGGAAAVIHPSRRLACDRASTLVSRLRRRAATSGCAMSSSSSSAPRRDECCAQSHSVTRHRTGVARAQHPRDDGAAARDAHGHRVVRAALRRRLRPAQPRDGRGRRARRAGIQPRRREIHTIRRTQGRRHGLRARTHARTYARPAVRPLCVARSRAAAHRRRRQGGRVARRLEVAAHVLHEAVRVLRGRPRSCHASAPRRAPAPR
jgi:hypothetical protein